MMFYEILYSFGRGFTFQLLFLLFFYSYQFFNNLILLDIMIM